MRFGHEITEGWRLTEAGANNAINPLEGRKKIGSIGLPMKGAKMKVIDSKGGDPPWPGRRDRYLRPRTDEGVLE